MYLLEWSNMIISVSDFSNVAYFDLYHYCILKIEWMLKTLFFCEDKSSFFNWKGMSQKFLTPPCTTVAGMDYGHMMTRYQIIYSLKPYPNPK